MDEVLAGGLLDVVVRQGGFGEGGGDGDERVEGEGKGVASQKVFQGGDGPRFVGRYVPLMQRPRMESVEIINARYAKRKGFELKEESRDQGFRTLSGEGKEIEGNLDR